jgi:hypothetical protein
LSSPSAADDPVAGIKPCPYQIVALIQDAAVDARGSAQGPAIGEEASMELVSLFRRRRLEAVQRPDSFKISSG